MVFIYMCSREECDNWIAGTTVDYGILPDVQTCTRCSGVLVLDQKVKRKELELCKKYAT